MYRKMNKTLLIDFDGVVHSNKSKWTSADEILDEPTPGAFDFLERAVEKFDVCIYSSRSGAEGGIKAMREWFLLYGLSSDVIELLRFPTEKPAGFLTLDDRCICFDDIDNFVPWNKK